MMTMSISNVRFSAAAASDVHSGLLGWLSFDLDSLRLDGIALRRTADGRLTLSFPARADSAGRQHPYIRPLNETTRQEFEHQVLRALGFEEELAQ